ncbi:uncharacterized protein LOC109838446 [Asparagus officinalis]|uniref:uncharacterized protein LOC109838446 n=1 Tax=Asparagus officinalis TaxID=4686 RepID=UPI00098DFFDA|nr:uncharacterized protein LOC109838446 [Asparagus officinalis]
MNKALLGKWIWKWFDDKIDLWKKISFYKYFENKNWSDYFCSDKKSLSHFWRVIFINVDSFLCSTSIDVGNGHNTLYWLDKWTGANTLASMFPSLYNIASFPYATITSLRKKLNNDWIWDIKFQKQLTGNLVFQYYDMLNSIMLINFVHREDKRKWIWEAKDKFTVKTYYHFLIDGGSRYDCLNLWKLSVPLKVKFLVWLALRSSLNTKKNLVKKGIHMDVLCCFCSKEEENHLHLFVNCEFVYSIWRSVQFKLNIKKDFKLSSLKDIWKNWSDEKYDSGNIERDVILCSLIWCIWQERNDRIFSNKKRRSLELLNKILTFAKFWIGSQIFDRAARLQERRRKKAASVAGISISTAGGVIDLLE